jgi:hypothetical protein
MLEVFEDEKMIFNIEIKPET